MNPSSRLVQTYFLYSGNSMLSFGAFFLLLEAMIEIRGNQFKKKNIFLLVEAISDFLPEEGVFPYSGNVFLNESFIPAIEERFFLVETVYYT